MDTSEQYIKQCEKAEKIQKSWIPAWGDWDYSPPNPDRPEHGILGLCSVLGSNYFGHPLAHNIWLPTQDRLQEMVGHLLGWSFMLDYFEQWRIAHREEIPPETTPEQLWLAFVMKEKFGKVWDGETWVESKS
jgi:hypothetical protein